MQSRRIGSLLALAAVALAAAAVRAAPGRGHAQPEGFEYRTETWHGVRFAIVRADPARTRIQLYWRDAAGRGYGSQARLATALRAQGETLLAASNAGIFGFTAPDGLHVERGRVLAPLNLRQGRGNFYEQPNAVFFVTSAGRAEIVESNAARARIPEMAEATQSGPALLLDGALAGPAAGATPASMLAGTRVVRNGVCVDGRSVYLVKTDDPLTRAHLALFFRDRLRCGDGLYLDGSTPSSLHVPGRRRESRNSLMGILAILPRT
ncbi:MAG TPA: phosphodiester glycosidase family protein [Longimicrobium sp.]|jgi:uncharacterized protein YigE (DUF2233 family)|uniref:phosphodiester glycosidase family protein n=1 Tax=Longimicrobium sp. TaxID=2029185 RepID=UPI002EDA3ADC